MAKYDVIRRKAQNMAIPFIVKFRFGWNFIQTSFDYKVSFVLNNIDYIVLNKHLYIPVFSKW